MMRAQVLAFAILLFTSLGGFSQQQVPVFKSAADSAAYADIQIKLTSINKLMADEQVPGGDSLMVERNRLFNELVQIMNSGILRYKTIYVSSFALTSYEDFVKSGDPAKVTTLSISGKNRKSLPDSLFLCQNLQELELVNWKLSRLPRELRDLNKLRKLTLLNNQPSSRLRLKKNTSIKELTIRGDDGSGKLPSKYKRLQNLKTLDVSRNALASLPNLSGCSRLTNVVASFNEITLDDLHGRQPGSLTEVNLANNKIKVIPGSIAAFENAKKLIFANNQIEEVSDEIRNLKYLEEISFYKNNLKAIPSSLYELPDLKVIDLYYNDIEVTDVRLGQMQSLEILYLANNRIYTLPDNLGQLVHLRELYLHHNRLSNLPGSVAKLQDLTVLRINNNSLLEFPDVLFGLERLQNLDLSNNQLTSLSVSNFNFKQLQILSLAGNPWDGPTKQALPGLAQRLRTDYKTVVHLNTYEQQNE